MAAVARKKNPYDNLDKSLSMEVRKRLNAAMEAFNAGKFQQSAGLCQDVLRSVTNQPQAANMLSSCLFRLGNIDQAYTMAKQLVEVHPRFARAYNNLGIFAKALGKADEAIVAFEKARALGFDQSSVFLELGKLYMERNVPAKAVEAYSQFLLREPHMDVVWEYICVAAAQSGTLDVSPSLKKLLEQRLQERNASSSKQCLIAVNYLNNVMGLRNWAQNVDLLQAFRTELYETEVFQTVLKEPIFQHYVENHIISDKHMERALTYLRGYWLLESNDEVKRDKLLKQFTKQLRALERQCFRNEYVFAVSAQEEQMLKVLKQRLAQMDAFSLQSKQGQWQIMLLACYQPLEISLFSCDIETLQKGANAALLGVLRRHILNRQEEQALANKIPSFGEVQDSVSQRVKQMYEENPYPRWEQLVEVQSHSVRNELKHAFHPSRHALADMFPEHPSVLVAGCGTGQHALQAHQRMHAESTLAIDLSLASIAYATRKATEHKETSITFMQGDILELPILNQQFDVVESIGVIHHMQEPAKGLEALLACLKPNGLLRLGLYSELARQGVVAGRDYIAKQGYEATVGGIRAFRQSCVWQDKAPEEMAHVMGSLDFYSLSNCRDLLFHVQEHRFTIPQLQEWFAKYDLEFMGFVSVGEMVRNNFLRTHGPNAYWSLDTWHEFEQANPHSFMGMYNFWLHKPA